MSFLKKISDDQFRLLTALFVMAALVRLTVVLSLDYESHFERTRAIDPTYDAIVYHELAISLMNGDGMMSGQGAEREHDFRRPPVYPLFLAGVYRVFGVEIRSGQIVQVFVGAFTIILFYLLCLEYVRKRFALLASIILVFYLPHAAVSATIMTVVWTTLLMIVTLLFITRAYKQDSSLYWALSGVAYAALILTRQYYKFAWIFILLGLVWLYFRDWKKLSVNIAAFVIPALACIMPWILYVYGVTGKMQFDTILPKPFVAIYGEMLRTETRLGLIDDQERQQIDAKLGEKYWRKDRETLMNESMDYVTRNPGNYLLGLLYKSQYLWVRSFWIADNGRGNLFVDISPFMQRKYWQEKNYPILFVNLLTALFALAGMWGVLRYWKSSFPLAMAIFLTVAGYTLLYSSDRYGLPVHPFIILYAVLGINYFSALIQRKTPQIVS